jgi:hypothetical protein
MDDYKKLSAFWRAKGLKGRAAGILAACNCLNEQDVRAIGVYTFLYRTPNCSKVTTEEIGRVLFNEKWNRDTLIKMSHTDKVLIDELRARGYTVTRGGMPT